MPPTTTASVDVKVAPAVGLGPSTIAGGSVTLVAYVLAIVAFASGARDEATISALVVGTVSLVTTLGGRYAQAVSAIGQAVRLAEEARYSKHMSYEADGMASDAKDEDRGSDKVEGTLLEARELVPTYAERTLTGLETLGEQVASLRTDLGLARLAPNPGPETDPSGVGAALRARNAAVAPFAPIAPLPEDSTDEGDLPLKPDEDLADDDEQFVAPGDVAADHGGDLDESTDTAKQRADELELAAGATTTKKGDE